MTLAESIVSTAVDTDNYEIDFGEVLKVAATRGCLHRFGSMVEFCEEMDYELSDLKDVVDILLDNNDTKGIDTLAKHFSDWERYIPMLINNENILDVVLGYVAEIEDESILKMFAEKGNMELVRFVKDLDFSEDYGIVDELISIALNNDHHDLYNKLLTVKNFQML